MKYVTLVRLLDEKQTPILLHRSENKILLLVDRRGVAVTEKTLPAC